MKGVTLTTASRIYIAQDAKINKEFAALSRDVFNSDVKNIDFSKNVDSAKEINTWVRATYNGISLVLINKARDLAKNY